MIKKDGFQMHINSLGEVWLYSPKVLGKEYAINMSEYNKKGTWLGDMIQGLLQENATKEE